MTTFDNYQVTDEEPPRLSIQTDQFNVPFVSWPASATIFHLQSTLTMSPPGWITITNDISPTNGTNQYARFSPRARGRFFRLDEMRTFSNQYSVASGRRSPRPPIVPAYKTDY